MTNTQVKEDYVDRAEKFMKYGHRAVTTSKIRDLMAQVNELYNDIILEKEEILDQKYVDSIRHLKVKMIYDAGRDAQTTATRNKRNIGRNMQTEDIKKYHDGQLVYFFKETGLLDMVDKIGNSRKAFLDYCKYFEALVAYHKYYGGKE